MTVTVTAKGQYPTLADGARAVVIQIGFRVAPKPGVNQKRLRGENPSRVLCIARV